MCWGWIGQELSLEMMCHNRTQNTNKTLRAICQRQKAMVRAYLSKKNEMTPSKRLIYLVIALSLPL